MTDIDTLRNLNGHGMSGFTLHSARMRFTGFDIVMVDPGTEIECEGEKLTVTDGGAVRKGRKFYVTPKQYAAIKAMSKSKEHET